MDELKDFTIELSDFAISKIIENEIVAEIPLVGTAVKLAKVSLSIKDRIFLNKIKFFLDNLEKVDKEKLEKYLDDLKSSEKEQEKVGTILIELIDKSDETEKAILISKLFVCYLSGLIDLNLFRRLSRSLNLAFIEDIQIMLNPPSDKFFMENPSHYNYREGLLICGFSKNSDNSSGMIILGETWSPQPYSITTLGKLFLDCLKKYEDLI